MYRYSFIYNCVIIRHFYFSVKGFFESKMALQTRLDDRWNAAV